MTTSADIALRHDVFHAIADPTRRRILELLKESEMSVTAIVSRFSVTQPAISQHLKVLRDAGLVAMRKVSRQRLYSLHAEPLADVDDWVGYFEDYWTEKMGELGRYLDANPD